jgi:hypothetical protein
MSGFRTAGGTPDASRRGPSAAGGLFAKNARPRGGGGHNNTGAGSAGGGGGGGGVLFGGGGGRAGGGSGGGLGIAHVRVPARGGGGGGGPEGSVMTG